MLLNIYRGLQHLALKFTAADVVVRGKNKMR
jgi:hypothetical protein